MIKGPYTTKFPFQPHKPFERFRGRSEFNEEYCIGCTACVQVCPTKAIEFEDRVENGKASRVFTVRWDICIFCGQCQANCPPLRGITLSQKFDLATTGKREDLRQTIEKELVVCDTCHEVIAPRDQINWVAKRLGPLSFANASLILFYLRNLGLALKESPQPKAEKEYSRSDRIKILCPRCRREAVIKS